MSDEPDHRPDEEAGEHGAAPDGDRDGLGLTEEFARIEAEIEAEIDEEISEELPAAVSGNPGEQEEPPPVRFDETDESDVPAAVPMAGATEEWQPENEPPAEQEAPGGGSAEDAEQEETDLAGGEADPPEPPPEPQAPDGMPEDEEEPATAFEADAPAEEHTVVRPGPAPRPGGAVPLGAAGPARGDVEVEERPRSLWWRFLTGSVLIVLSTATAVALSTLVFFTDLARDLQPISNIKGDLTEIDPGDPQTILIVGSDERSDTPGDPGRSDTTMLLRVDAENEVLSLFSLPRDLKVDIAGDKYGVGKLNEAYTYGGISKTLKTVQDLTGLKIHHVVNVDFQGFADAVDAIGCVYVDVDRDYFNDNSAAYSVADQYATIDINAGYQRLCGQNALDYVRYRHTDTDIVRAARQQDFLSQARQQVPVREVLPIIGGDTSSKLLKIFTDYTRSDISEASEVIGVLKAFIGVIDVPIKEVHFEGHLGPVYVTASQKEIDKAVDEFLGEEDTAGPRGGSGGAGKPSADKPKKKGKKKSSASSLADADVVDADPGIARFAGTSNRRLNFPIFFPTKMAGNSVYMSAYSDDSRQYDIRDLDDRKQPAYKLVISYTSPSTVPEYYGVEGTTWDDPPILRDPSESREIRGRQYDLYYAGDRLRLVAWHEGGGSYWLSNTLLQTLDESQMLAIAASMRQHEG